MNRTTPLAIVSLALSCTAGCWEVIPYKGEASRPASRPRDAAPKATEPPDAHALFGDENKGADAAPTDARPRPAPAAEIVPPKP